MKQPLLLLHGALGSEDQLVPLKKLLSEHREVHALNFDGHGNSKAESDFSIALFSENVVSFLEKRNLTSVDVFGYSMGGYVALHLAANYTSLVNKIITLGTKFSWNPDFAAKEIRMLNPDLMMEKVPAFVKQLQDRHGLENWKNVIIKTAALMQDLGENPPLKKADFSKISNSVLICLGELDKMSTVVESKQVAEYLQNGSFKPIENFKHPIETVQNEVLGKIINTFLDEKI